MAFLDKMTDFSRTVAKKSEQMMDTAKLKVKISENRSIMKDYEIQLGKLVYEKYNNGEMMEEQWKELCEKIKEKETENEELQRALSSESL